MNQNGSLLALRKEGLYCEAGDFFIDPWMPVDKAIITHAHSDHARWGSRNYLTNTASENILKLRLGNEISCQLLQYGESISIKNVKVSFHPAGHILGSSQIRLEHNGNITVVSGDYKLDEDATTRQFELIKCNTFISESTFGLPIYKWLPQTEIFDEINSWWKTNQEEDKPSIIYAYALGKAQRIICGVNPDIGPIAVHGAVENINRCYRASGVKMPKTIYAHELSKEQIKKSLIIAPTSANGTPWLRRFGDIATAFASGWMQIRGARRRRTVDRGFVLSDHADWEGLNKVITECCAENIWLTHGYTGVMVNWLKEKGFNASVIPTQFEGERVETTGDTGEEIKNESVC